MRRNALVLIVVAVVVPVGWILLRGWPNEPKAPSGTLSNEAAVPEREVSTEIDADLVDEKDPSAESFDAAGDGGGAEGRAAASPVELDEPALCSVLVLDPERRPVPDATVSATPVLVGFVDPPCPWNLCDWSELGRLTSVSRTDGEGRAELSSFASVESPESVLWVTHPDHRAAFAMLRAGGEPPQSRTLELAPMAARMVRVQDRGGDPLEGAIVVQYGLGAASRRALGLPPLTGLEREAETAQSLLLREWNTLGDGTCPIAPMELPTLVVARAGALRSAPTLVERGQGPIVLTLGGSFRAQGTVQLPLGYVPKEEARVEVQARTGSRRDTLGIDLVRPDGRWGPIELAVTPADELLFRLVGAPLVAHDESRPPALAGSSLNVDFEPDLGTALQVRVRVESDDGPPVAGARVRARWLEGDAKQWQWASAWTDESGLATVEGCRMAAVTVRAEAEGFAPSHQIELHLPLEQELSLPLYRAGLVRGRCTTGGEPARDFEVTWWVPGVESYRTESFRDVEDGRFELRPPFGRVGMVASSTDSPEGPAKEIELVEGDPAEVTLELGEAFPGRGRIVDALTGEPLPDAKIRIWVSRGVYLIAARGDWRPVETDGSFEWHAFAASDSDIQVTAPGYGVANHMGSFRSEGFVDFGLIALSKTQTLEIRLVPRSPMALDTLWFRAGGAHEIDWHRFPADGVLHLDGVFPGYYRLFVVWQDGHSLKRIEQLVPGRDWTLEFPLDESRPLVVEVVPAEGQEIPSTAIFDLESWDEAGRVWVFTDRVPESGRAEVHHVQGELINAQVYREPDGPRLGIAWADLRTSGDRRIVVPFASRTLRARVVDREGTPLPDGDVQAMIPHGGAGVTLRETADAEGIASFHGLPAGRIYLQATHPTHGARASIPVDLPDDGEHSIDIVLDEVRELRLRLLDGETPLGGVEARVCSAFSHVPFARRSSETSGLVSMGRAAEGDYRVEVDHPGIWPTRAAIHFDGSEEPVPVQLRRLGDLRVSVRDAEGLALAGLAVSLSSLELGSSVAEWIQQGLVPGDPSQLVTGPAGDISLRALPRGSYLLRLVLPDGTPSEHTVQVEPGRATTAEIRVGS